MTSAEYNSIKLFHVNGGVGWFVKYQHNVWNVQKYCAEWQRDETSDKMKARKNRNENDSFPVSCAI